MKYLSVPCPRPDCGAATLRPPEKPDVRMYALCDTCKRKSLYIVNHKIDGNSYSVVPIGRSSSNMVKITTWITKLQAEELRARSIFPRMKAQIIRRALDVEFNFVHTLQYKP